MHDGADTAAGPRRQPPYASPIASATSRSLRGAVQSVWRLGSDRPHDRYFERSSGSLEGQRYGRPGSALRPADGQVLGSTSMAPRPRRTTVFDSLQRRAWASTSSSIRCKGARTSLRYSGSNFA